MRVHEGVLNDAINYAQKAGAVQMRGMILTPPRRHRERHRTKDLMSKTIAVHLRYKSLNISWASSAKQQREMIRF